MMSRRHLLRRGVISQLIAPLISEKMHWKPFFLGYCDVRYALLMPLSFFWGDNNFLVSFSAALSVRTFEMKADEMETLSLSTSNGTSISVTLFSLHHSFGPYHLCIGG
jgi:hypothetical protein